MSDTTTIEVTTEETKPTTETAFKPIQSQDEFDRMVADRLKRAESKAKSDAKAELAAEQKRIQTDAQAEAERQKQLAAGEFDAVKESLEKERDQYKGDYDGASEKLTKLIDAIRPDVDAAWKALPEEVSELYTGDEADILAKREFMTSHKKLIDKLTVTKEEENDRFRRVPNTPRPNPKAKDDIQPLVPAKF